MRKKTLVLFVVFLFFATSCTFSMIDKLIPSGGIKGVFGSDKVLDMDPPLIHSVKITPAEPKANEQVEVIAHIENDIARTDVTCEEAYIWYSVDGGKVWTKIEMEKMDDDKNFRGIIPGQPAGTTVRFYVQGIDSSGNLATEMPGINTVWPPVIDKDPTKSQLPLLCAPLTDPDTDKALLPDDIDILGLSVGYDEKSIYGALHVQGNISKGTMTPTWIQLYAVGIANVDKGEDLDKLIDAGVVVAKSELIAGAFGGLIGVTKPDFVIDKRIVGPDGSSPGKAVDDKESGLSVFTDKGTWYFKINREFSGLKGNKSGRFKLLSIAGAVTSTELSTFMSGGGIGGGNVSRFMNVYLRSNSYTVK